MKKFSFIILIGVLAAGSFLAGSWYGRKPASNNASDIRRVLYYVDPMNPTHTSDKPGLAPCGMKMEPVYADQGAPGKAAGGSSPMSPGTVRISPEKQQVIGVSIGQVERKAQNHTIRTLGRVAADETRVYRLNAAVDGWIRETSNNSTGSLVKKDEPLVSFYSPEFLSSQQAYLYALGAMDRFQATGKETPDQIRLTKTNIQQYVDSLRNLGMGEFQIKEIACNRQITQNILITSPADGFVLARNVSPGEKFEKGKELYRIVDLSQVWVLADLFENEAHYLKPGTEVRVTLPHQKKTFPAKVSNVLPQFEAASRTLKVRLEADNPEYELRPDMFVDVEFPIQLPPAITVPVDAVLDSGLKKTVFVDRGNGFFEPRNVETGWRMGDRVEIIKGLMAAERIVTSGTFLLDSESRMKLAAAGMSKAEETRAAKDPVCGMDVDENKAKTTGLMAEYRGKAYYFCIKDCKQAFDKDPGRYVERSTRSGEPSVTPIAQTEQRAKDPICGMEVDRNKAKVAGRLSEYRGKTYYFCADECKQQFDRDPKHFVEKHAGGGKFSLIQTAHAEERAKDPICSMHVDPSSAAKAGRMSEYHGKKYYFCADECKQQFDRDPNRYVEKTSGSGNPAVTPGQTEQQARDPACGKNVVISVAAKPTTMSEYRGKAYYFCCPHCKARFDKDPDRYI